MIMEADKLVITPYEPAWKEVPYTDVSSPSSPLAPSGSFEPETPSDINPVTPAPCSSPAVLKSYLAAILQPYGIAVSIFQHLTPGDILRWMLASKDMAEVLPRDPKLIRLMVDKHCITRPAPRLIVPCEWCSSSGCECASCFTWDHNGYGELNSTPQLTNPDKRIYTFCATCTKKLPKSVFDGRCLCNTKNLRSLCNNCKRKERINLVNAGLNSWFSAKRPREKLVEEEQRRDEEAMGEACGKRLCNGIDDDGYACENEVGSFGTGRSGDIVGEKVVNCCTWCGLVAVDVPINCPPRLLGCTAG